MSLKSLRDHEPEGHLRPCPPKRLVPARPALWRPGVGCPRRLGRKPGRRIAENGGTAPSESLEKGRLPGFSLVGGSRNPERPAAAVLAIRASGGVHAVRTEPCTRSAGQEWAATWLLSAASAARAARKPARASRAIRASASGSAGMPGQRSRSAEPMTASASMVSKSSSVQFSLKIIDTALSSAIKIPVHGAWQVPRVEVCLNLTLQGI